MATYAGVVTHLGGSHAGRYDYFHGVGDGVVAGDVKSKATPANIPTHCLVRLIRDQDALLVQAQWSHPTTGAFRFENLSLDYTYTVIAYDHTLNYRAVITDRVTPVSA